MYGHPQKHICSVSVFYFLALFLTTRLGTLIHELFGHGGAAILVGGRIDRIVIHLFATGYCSYTLEGEGLWEILFIRLAGIALNFATGIAVALFIARRDASWEVQSSLCIFAIVSIGSQLLYMVLGTYYDHGDPTILSELLGPAKWIVWLPFLVLVAPASFSLATLFLRSQERIFPCDGKTARVAIAALTIGAASILYGLCFYIEGKTTGFAGGMAASESRIATAAEEAIAGEALSDEERAKRLEEIEDELRPFPIYVPLLIIVSVSTVVAFVRQRPGRRASPLRRWFFWSAIVLALLVAALILASRSTT